MKKLITYLFLLANFACAYGGRSDKEAAHVPQSPAEANLPVRSKLKLLFIDDLEKEEEQRLNTVFSAQRFSLLSGEKSLLAQLAYAFLEGKHVPRPDLELLCLSSSSLKDYKDSHYDLAVVTTGWKNRALDSEQLKDLLSRVRLVLQAEPSQLTLDSSHFGALKSLLVISNDETLRPSLSEDIQERRRQLRDIAEIGAAEDAVEDKLLQKEDPDIAEIETAKDDLSEARDRDIEGPASVLHKPSQKWLRLMEGIEALKEGFLRFVELAEEETERDESLGSRLLRAAEEEAERDESLGSWLRRAAEEEAERDESLGSRLLRAAEEETERDESLGSRLLRAAEEEAERDESLGSWLRRAAEEETERDESLGSWLRRAAEEETERDESLGSRLRRAAEEETERDESLESRLDSATEVDTIRDELSQPGHYNISEMETTRNELSETSAHDPEEQEFAARILPQGWLSIIEQMEVLRERFSGAVDLGETGNVGSRSLEEREE